MLCARAAAARSHSLSPHSLSISTATSAANNPFLHRHRLHTRHHPPSLPYPSIRMSSSSPPSHSQIVEHFVLFKVKSTTDPSKVNAMITNLNSLSSLDTILHLSAGPIARNRSDSLSFTHLLHSRYASKSDLQSYTDHPSHVSVVSNYVRPIVDDVMAIDWVSENLAGPIKVPPGSATKITFLKLKEGLGESEKNEVLGVIGGIKEKFPAIEQLSFGENFSPGRAKGFSIGSIAVLPGPNDLEALDSQSELASMEKDKVRSILDSVLVLDYLVPVPQSASL